MAKTKKTGTKNKTAKPKEQKVSMDDLKTTAIQLKKEIDTIGLMMKNLPKSKMDKLQRLSRRIIARRKALDDIEAQLS